LELVNHIRDLLYHHDCVVVPGFGGFVTNDRSARIDRTTNSLYPPAREVGFNARLDHNDGLLISYLSARLSMNYVDVRKIVTSFVDDVNRRLDEGRVVHFEGIGLFGTDKAGNLQFDPDPSANFLTDAYGLSFFRFPAIENVEPVRKIHKKISETGRPAISDRAKRLLRYAAVTIPLLAALSWGAINTNFIREFSFDLSSLNPFSAVVDSGIKTTPVTRETDYSADSPVAGALEEMTSQQRALIYQEPSAVQVPDAAVADRIADEESVLPDQPVPSAEQALTVQETDLEEIADIVTPVTEEIVAPDSEIETRQVAGEARESVAEPEAGRVHYIVAGSFRSNQNANVLKEQLQQEGYSSQVIDPDGSLIYVTLYSTPNRGEARQMLTQVRTMAGKRDAWILTR